ncbi:hypothetical protein [Algivirga pacifica]|uniref:hypothetical protein n=1 Tax=Algivirga pacifica TaxID=1162670 RepID=UPI0031E7AD43
MISIDKNSLLHAYTLTRAVQKQCPDLPPAVLQTHFLVELFYHILLFRAGKVPSYPLPFTEDEIIIDRSVIFHQFLKVFDFDQPLSFLKTYKELGIESLLLLCGQRKTEGSLTTKDAIFPSFKQLLSTFQVPYNTDLSVGCRALSKHFHRTADTYWPILTGSPQQKESLATTTLLRLLKEKTWWNTFEHSIHGTVYEIRVASGHGCRWQHTTSNLKFIGFLEPFLK